MLQALARGLKRARSPTEKYEIFIFDLYSLFGVIEEEEEQRESIQRERERMGKKKKMGEGRKGKSPGGVTVPGLVKAGAVR